MENNPLLIIEENEDNQLSTITSKEKEEKEDPGSKLKLAMKNKRLKENFLQGANEMNQTTEIMNEEFENEIDKSILDLEDNASLVYSSESDDDDEDNCESIPSNGTCISDDNSGEYDVGAVETSSLRSTYGQQIPSILLPFYERRRLSECKEESESDEETEQIHTKPTITVTSTNGITHKTEISADVLPPRTKQRFVVTKTVEEDMKVIKPPQPQTQQQPVSILKKTPSPPSQQKLIQQQSPKKIRYEAEDALKDISATKNSQTIHFPCTPSSSSGRTNVKSIFSPQGILSPHLDKRYFDTSLVEIRSSKNQLITSTKSLDGTSTEQQQPLNDIWIKRTDLKQPNSINNKASSNSDKISVSSDSVTSSNCSSRKNDVSFFSSPLIM